MITFEGPFSYVRKHSPNEEHYTAEVGLRSCGFFMLRESKLTLTSFQTMTSTRWRSTETKCICRRTHLKHIKQMSKCQYMMTPIWIVSLHILKISYL